MKSFQHFLRYKRLSTITLLVEVPWWKDTYYIVYTVTCHTLISVVTEMDTYECTTIIHTFLALVTLVRMYTICLCSIIYAWTLKVYQYRLPSWLYVGTTSSLSLQRTCMKALQVTLYLVVEWFMKMVFRIIRIHYTWLSKGRPSCRRPFR